MNTKNEKSLIPKWIEIYAIFLMLLSLLTAILGYFYPKYIFPNLLQTHTPELYFYAARNLGLFVGFGYCLFLNNSKSLINLFIIRFVIEFLDLFATIRFELVEYNVTIVSLVWLAVFLIPEFIAIIILKKLNS